MKCCCSCAFAPLVCMFVMLEYMWVVTSLRSACRWVLPVSSQFACLIVCLFATSFYGCLLLDA